MTVVPEDVDGDLAALIAGERLTLGRTKERFEWKALPPSAIRGKDALLATFSPMRQR